MACFFAHFIYCSMCTWIPTLSCCSWPRSAGRWRSWRSRRWCSCTAGTGWRPRRARCHHWKEIRTLHFISFRFCIGYIPDIREGHMFVTLSHMQILLLPTTRKDEYLHTFLQYTCCKAFLPLFFREMDEKTWGHTYCTLLCIRKTALFPSFWYPWVQCSHIM